MRDIGQNGHMGQIPHVNAVLVHKLRQGSRVYRHEVYVVKHLDKCSDRVRFEVLRSV